MSVVNAILVFSFIVGWGIMVGALVGFLFAVRELRKLTNQIRHMAQVYFPAHMNEAANGAARPVIETSVEINDVWDPKEEPRG